MNTFTLCYTEVNKVSLVKITHVTCNRVLFPHSYAMLKFVFDNGTLYST